MASIRGENLKKVMEIKGWKQIHLARLTGYSRSYVSRVLSGKANPSAEFILRVGELFPGFEHNHFFIPEQYPYGTHPGDRQYLNPCSPLTMSPPCCNATFAQCSVCAGRERCHVYSSGGNTASGGRV